MNNIIINNKEYEVIAYITVDSGNFIVYTEEKRLENGTIVLYVNRISIDNNEILFDEMDNDDLTKVINKLKERLGS